jgi:hypothetical protein
MLTKQPKLMFLNLINQQLLKNHYQKVQHQLVEENLRKSKTYKMIMEKGFRT